MTYYKLLKNVENGVLYIDEQGKPWLTWPIPDAVADLDVWDCLDLEPCDAPPDRFVEGIAKTHHWTDRAIVVLEDTDERIDWLKAEFPSRRVSWSSDVNGLFSLLAAEEQDPHLIILDHDLGGRDAETLTFPYDCNRMCGMDAADQLPEKWQHVPIIVWSINRPRAQEMVLRLKDRGFSATHVPFSSSVGAPIRRAIASVLEQADD